MNAAFGLMVTLYMRYRCVQAGVSVTRVEYYENHGQADSRLNSFRQILGVQLELWLTNVILPLAEGGSGTPSQVQRAALEVSPKVSQTIVLGFMRRKCKRSDRHDLKFWFTITILQAIADLCRQTTFVTDLFCNFDCDLRSPNLFARTAALLCKSAFPVSGPMMANHTVALEVRPGSVLSSGFHCALGAPSFMTRASALFAGTSLRTRGPCRSESWARAAHRDRAPTAACGFNLLRSFDLARATWSGERRSFCRCSWRPAGTCLSAPVAPARLTAPASLCSGRHSAFLLFRLQMCALYLRKLKFLKERIAVGSDHFNRDAKKGIQFLTTVHLLPSEPDSAAVACFLRYAIGLDKTAIGDYLGEKDAFAVSVLDHFAHLFDFKVCTWLVNQESLLLVETVTQLVATRRDST